MQLPFTKLHGLGNSYIYFDLVSHQHLRETELDWPELARRVSDVRFGLGADGLILVMPGNQAPLRMRIFNADGSEAEMCGNGIRGLAKYAYDHGLVQETSFAVETLAGLRYVQLTVAGDKCRTVRVDMGAPGLRRSQIPMTGPAQEMARDIPLTLDGLTVIVQGISMGNPHCVLWVDDVATAPVSDWGPRLEHHPAFPQRTNVEFVQVLNPRELRMRVWERGSGETYACGTGACAAAVAAMLAGKAEAKVRVYLRGGPLDIEWQQGGSVYMTGPATEVCSGVLAPEWWAENVGKEA